MTYDVEILVPARGTRGFRTDSTTGSRRWAADRRHHLVHRGAQVRVIDRLGRTLPPDDEL